MTVLTVCFVASLVVAADGCESTARTALYNREPATRPIAAAFA